MNKLLVVIALLSFLAVGDVTLAHPGNTASDGCHYCRTNCDKWGVPWNERHCHNAPAPFITPKTTTPTIPTPKKYEFNGKTYSSFTDYLNAKEEYDRQQAEIVRLQEEKAKLEQELIESTKKVEVEQKRNLNTQSSTNAVTENPAPEQAVAGAETTEKPNETNGGFIALVVIAATSFLGLGVWLLRKVVRG